MVLILLLIGCTILGRFCLLASISNEGETIIASGNDLAHRARRPNYKKGLNWLEAGMQEAEQIPCKRGKFPLVVTEETVSALSCDHHGLQVLRDYLWTVEPELG